MILNATIARKNPNHMKEAHTYQLSTKPPKENNVILFN